MSAIDYNDKRANLFCPHCHERHVDEGDWATKPHTTHLCEHCKGEFDVSHPRCFGKAAPADAAGLNLAIAEMRIQKLRDALTEVSGLMDHMGYSTSKHRERLHQILEETK